MSAKTKSTSLSSGKKNGSFKIDTPGLINTIRA